MSFPNIKQMLLKLGIHYTEFQVKSDEGKPYSRTESLVFTCVICGYRLHGHGWRERIVYDEDNQQVIIWVHRKRCPSCGQTYTLLPLGVHAFMRHVVAVITAVIDSFLETRHLVHRISGWVDLRLRRIWVRNFLLRYRIMNTTTVLPKCCLKEPYIAAPVRLNVTKLRADAVSLRKRFHMPYHLYLLHSE